MIPIGDDDSDRRIKPIVNWLLIAANVFVFVAVQGLGSNQRTTLAFATVPAEILTGHDIAEVIPVRDEYGRVVDQIEIPPTPIPVYMTLLTSMFLHGNIAHIFGNMLYLGIFGDNVEDRLGHGRYLAFYLLTGVLAGIAHVMVTAVFGNNALVPSLGASGAISGVLGGYIVLFPHRRVRLLWLYSVFQAPALLAIGVWFLFQLLAGAGSLGREMGGVAYGAHIGGFVAGAVLIKFFAVGRQAPPAAFPAY